MDNNEYIEFLRSQLKNKGLNEETIGYACKYVELNQKLFSNSINMEKLTTRLANNLQHNIISVNNHYGLGKAINSVISTVANWEPYAKELAVSPLFKVTEKMSSKMRLAKESNIFHELDHCATTEYISMTENQQEEYINNVINANGMTNKQDIDIFKRMMKEAHQVSGGEHPIVGVKDAKVNELKGLNLNQLNEGITVYKQKKYDEVIGKKFKTAYKSEKKVAELLAKTIGEDKMIELHFNNDYETMKELFNRETGKDLNYIVQKLNKIKATNLMYTGSLGDMAFSKMLNSYLEGKETTEQGLTVQYDGKNPIRKLFQRISNRKKARKQNNISKEIDISNESKNQEHEQIETPHQKFVSEISKNGRVNTTQRDVQEIQEQNKLNNSTIQGTLEK